MDANEIKSQLERPFPVDKVHWRVGATTGDKSRGIALAYVDSRDVMKRLDDVAGPDGWQRRYSHVVNGLVVCEVGVNFGNEWIWKADGAGQTDYEGDKGSMSDSFKRAAVNFGIARYLYALPAPWAAIKSQGKSYVLAETPPLPKWATPDGYDELVARGGEPGPDKTHKQLCDEASQTHATSVQVIKDGIYEGNYSAAAEAWFELDDETKHALWLAPSKGGIFTTTEREIMKTSEFRQSYYGTTETA